MRRYETIFILDPDLSEEGRVPVFDRVLDLIPSMGGTLFERDDWGARRLAYEIKKRSRGYYTRLDYCGPESLVDEIERNFRIDDRVLKYLTVMTDDHPDAERILADIAAAKAPTETAPEQATSAEETTGEATADSAETPEASGETPEAPAETPAETPEATETPEKSEEA